MIIIIMAKITRKILTIWLLCLMIYFHVFSKARKIKKYFLADKGIYIIEEKKYHIVCTQ